MAKENIVSSSLRFNLENEQHLRVYQYLNKVDSDVHGSRNKFIIQALDEYFRGGGDVSSGNGKDSCDNEEFLEKVFEKTQEAVLRSLGCFYAGSGGDVNVNNGIVKEGSDKQEEGVSNMEVLGLIDSWNI